MENKYSNFGNVCNVTNNLKPASFKGIVFLVEDELSDFNAKEIPFVVSSSLRSKIKKMDVFSLDEEDGFTKIKKMNCTECEDSGYVFNTLYPCDKCDLGKPIQHEQNKQELERLLKRAKFLRKVIKIYNQSDI